jgi:hypothetical protein
MHDARVNNDAGSFGRFRPAQVRPYVLSMSQWTIAAAELRIPWNSDFAAHRMIVVADPHGVAVRQLNGLARWFDAGACRWRSKPIGYLWTDRLRGYDTDAHRDTYMPIHGAEAGTWRVNGALERGHMQALASGPKAEIDARLSPGLEAMRRINALSDGPEGGAGLPYPFLGFGRNSNSFFSTLLSAMGLDEPRFARPARLNPGAGSFLLPETTLAAIRQSAGSAATSGAMKSATGPAIASTPFSVG